MNKRKRGHFIYKQPIIMVKQQTYLPVKNLHSTTWRDARLRLLNRKDREQWEEMTRTHTRE